MALSTLLMIITLQIHRSVDGPSPYFMGGLSSLKEVMKKTTLRHPFD
jgi:hypothetical protein